MLGVEAQFGLAAGAEPHGVPHGQEGQYPGLRVQRPSSESGSVVQALHLLVAGLWATLPGAGDIELNIVDQDTSSGGIRFLSS